jgi:hypothetical protein
VKITIKIGTTIRSGKFYMRCDEFVINVDSDQKLTTSPLAFMFPCIFRFNKYWKFDEN